MNLPPRYEGDHICIGQAVRDEAKRMLDASPYTGGAGKHVPHDVRLARMEDHLWGWLRMGWTRLRDDGVIVHWHPGAGDWVPFSASLHTYYTRLGNDTMTWYRHLADQRLAPKPI